MSFAACRTTPRIDAKIAAARGCDAIRVCSFNIFQFGAHEDTRDYAALATALEGCDAIFLQEVRDRGGEAAVRRLAEELGGFDYAVSASAGDHERFALLWRDPVDAGPLEMMEAPTDLFARRPALATLSAGDFDGVFATVHLAYGDLDQRRAELEFLLAWIFSDPYRPKERDLIVLGDTNRYGKGGDEFGLATDAAQRGLLRVPFEETARDPRAKTADDPRGATTFGKKAYQYDQFIVSPGLGHELGPAPARLGHEVGAVHDGLEAIAELAPSDRQKKFSDHRPVWLSVCTDRGDDDPS